MIDSLVAFVWYFRSAPLALAPDEVLAEIWRPGQEPSASEVNSETAMVTASARKKRAGHTGDGDQRQKNDDRRDGRSDQRDRDFLQRTVDAPARALPGIAMEDDVFHHHDGIVDHQSDRGGEATKRHQVETFAQHLQSDKGDEHSDGNDQAGDHRGAPIAQKNNQNDGGENETDAGWRRAHS